MEKFKQKTVLMLSIAHLVGCSSSHFANDNEAYVHEFEKSLVALSNDEMFASKVRGKSFVVLVSKDNQTDYFIGDSLARILEMRLDTLSGPSYEGSVIYYQDSDRRITPTIHSLEVTLDQLTNNKKLLLIEERVDYLEEELIESKANLLQTMKLVTMDAIFIEELETQMDTISSELNGINSSLSDDAKSIEEINTQIQQQLSTIQTKLAGIEDSLSKL